MEKIESVMQTTLNELKEMIDVNTIVGTPVTSIDGITIIPISKVSFGFVSGGADYGLKQKNSETGFGAGSGAGVSLNPVGFLVVGKDSIDLIPSNYDTTFDRLVEMIPSALSTIKDSLNKKEC